MNRQQSEKFKSLISDNTSGSSEIVNELNNLYKLLYNNPVSIQKSLKIANDKLGHFAAIKSYINNLQTILNKKNKNILSDFLNNYSENENDKYNLIFEKLFGKMKNINNILTLSRSGTLLKIFELWKKKNKNLKVIVCESRPAFEGRLFAEDLLKTGIKTELITDAMMGIYVPQIDAAIIGADSILANGNVVNKTGSLSLALLCKEFRIPFYVLTTKEKKSLKRNFEIMKNNPGEVWDKKHKNLLITNIYFEEVKRKLITAIITD